MSQSTRKSAGKPSYMRQLNRSLVIGILRSGEPMSRSALARATGLSNTTMTNVVGDLLHERLLLMKAAGKPTSSRQRRSTLRINAQYGLAAGLEVTDGTATAAVTDWCAQSLATAHRPFSPLATTPEIVSALIEVLEEALDMARRESPAELRGIGVAFQGLVDVNTDISVAIPGLPAWSSVQAGALLETHFGVPVAIDWRVYAAALAEMWLGAAKEHSDFLYVNVGSGIAMASVVDNTIVRRDGALAGQAGLLGHIMVRPGGNRCYFCGNFGCLDNESSIPAIVEKVRSARRSGVEAPFQELDVQDTHGAFHQIVGAAEQGEQIAVVARIEAAEYLGIALAHLLHLFNPSLVIIGGDIAVFGTSFLEEVRLSARRHSLPRSFADAELVLSDLRPDSATLGAACLVLMQPGAWPLANPASRRPTNV